MKEKRLLYAIGWVKDEYIVEMNRPGTKNMRKRPNRRLWLIAAVVAALLILAGCATVFLRLQDLSFGTQTYVKEFDSQGLYIGPTEKNKDLLTINGYVGSPHQMAVQEWVEFQKSYDSNHELLTNEPDIPEIPNAEEMVYSCYTLEMVEKLHEIVDKYSFKLLEEWVPIQRWQNETALKALEIDSLLKPGAPAEISAFSGMLYPPYNFQFEYSMTMTGEDALWPHEMVISQRYDRKGYFQPLSYWAVDLDRVQQWNYTTSEGFELLLVLDDKGNGHILLEKEEAYWTVFLSTYTGRSQYPSPEEYISRAGLEQAAEVFDYSITPPMLDAAGMQEELDAAEKNYQESKPTPPTLPRYSSFDECMKREGVWRGPEGYDYTFYDVDADGEMELLFGWNGMSDTGIDIENGETTQYFYGGTYFCANGIRHSIHTYEFSTFEVHTFTKWPEFSLCLTRKNGVWHKSEEAVDYASVDALPTLTDAQAQEIIDSYPHEEFYWKPVLEYTFADGTTVAEIVPDPVPAEPVTPDRLSQKYREIATKFTFYTHYCLYDLNGDGIDEMLLGTEGQILTAYGLLEGEVQELESRGELHPCEGGVWEDTMLMSLEEGVELEEHIFCRMADGKPEVLHYVAWNKATASWVSDRDYTPMEEHTARAILEKYPRAEIKLLPISEWSEG